MILSRRFRLRATLTLASVLVVGGYFLVEVITTPDSTGLFEGGANRIDFFASEALLTRWSKPGQALSQTYSEAVTHYPDQQQSQLDFPYATGFSAAGETLYTVRANSGIYRDDNSQLSLAGDVELHHNPGKSNEVELYTARLEYFPEKQLATSDQEVEILTPGGETLANGMELYTAEQRLELLSNVRGRYENRSSQ